MNHPIMMKRKLEQGGQVTNTQQEAKGLQGSDTCSREELSSLSMVFGQRFAHFNFQHSLTSPFFGQTVISLSSVEKHERRLKEGRDIRQCWKVSPGKSVPCVGLQRLSSCLVNNSLMKSQFSLRMTEFSCVVSQSITRVLLIFLA